MLNQIVIVGRIVKEVEFTEGENGIKTATMTLAVPRSYKNSEGQYDTDFIDFILYNGTANNTAEYCSKGDIIGVKGRIQCNDETEHRNEIIAERVTFLSSKSENEE